MEDDISEDGERDTQKETFRFRRRRCRDVCEVKMSKWCITVVREGESIDRQQRLPRGSYVAQNLSKKPLFQ